MVDFDAKLPIRGLAVDLTTEVANAAGTTINPAEDYAQGSTTSGENNVLAGGATTAAAPVYADGTTNPLSLDTAGNLRVTSSAVPLQNVNITEIGGNAVTTTTLPVSGTVAVTQSTSPWVVSGTVTSNIGTTGGLALDATLTNGTQHTLVDNFPVTQPVSGTVAVSNFPADADALAQGSATAGQLGALEMGAVTTAAPLYVTGTTSPLSLDINGNLRTTGTFTPSGTQDVNIVSSIPLAVTGPLTDAQLRATPVPVSGTVTANLGTVDGLALDATLTNGTQVTSVSNFPAIQPVSGTVTVVQPTGSLLNVDVVNFPATLEVTQGTSPWVVSLASTTITGSVAVTGTFWQATQPISGSVTVSNFPADADALAQGSTTAGQLGALVMGATTTAAPVYSTTTTNPLSLDVAGNLRVISAGGANTTPAALTYFTDVAVASNASVTHSVAGPINLDAIHGAGSGEIKMTIAIGTTGAETIYWNGFTSASNQDCEFALKNTYVIPAGSSVKVTILNRDTQAQDVYLTFVTH